MAENTLYRVALASNDGENVNVHFGKADTFLGYSLNDESDTVFFEKRSVTPVCKGGSHDEERMKENASLFEDCRYVIAERIGRAAGAHLAANGVTAMELPGSIADAVLKVQKYNQIQGLFA